MKRTYDVAAYIWPAYTGKEPRTRMFWPDGIGEWQTVKRRLRNMKDTLGRAVHCGATRTRLTLA